MDRMKDYRQLIKELPSTTLVCALGDFDPPTTAHELLVKTVNRLAEQKNTDHVIYASTKDSLIQEEKKEQYLKLMFPKTKFKSVNESKISNLLEELSKKYKKLIIVAGSEQVAGLKKLVKENTQIIAINEKNPDANYAKMKQLAVKGLYEEFKKKLPSTIRELDGRRLMNDVRHGLGLEPVKEQLVLVKDKLREEYFRGEIFKEGDIVESNGEQFTIVKRGSNHLLLKEESGKLVSKWIQDVKPMEDKAMNEGVIQQNGTDKLEPSTSDTGAKQDITKPTGKTKGFLTFYNYNTKDPVKEEADPVAKERMKAQLSLKHAKEKETLAAKHAQEKENLQTEELEEAKKKPVCPTCGKHECECNTGVDKTSYNHPFDPFFKEDLTEEEIDEMVNSVTDEDIEDLYEEDELVLVYDDDGEEIPPLQEESKYDLMEVLSRTERMKGKIRLRKTSAKRGRSTKIALKRYSNPETINKRARRLAIKLMKQRMLRGRDPAKVSIGEKERMEKVMAQRKDVISRIAQKLVSRVRKVEKARMSHGKVTKGSMPSVF
jgi:phosphopantetheine adenylyltransferase